MVPEKDRVKQLELSVHELEAIGFTGNYSPADPDNPSRVYYSIPILNGEFLYNVENAPHKWYFRNNNGEGYNNNWLNIRKLPELYILLSCFNAKYKLVIF